MSGEIRSVAPSRASADGAQMPTGSTKRILAVRSIIYRLRARLGLLPKCNSVRHAERELALLGQDDPMQRAMNKHLLHMVREFSKEGHSGFSASYALSVLQRLLRFEPVTPLTGADDEWNDIGHGEYQNNRCGRVFKGPDGRAYDIDGRVFREPSGACYTGRGSRVYITFPYTPTTEYVDVPA